MIGTYVSYRNVINNMPKTLASVMKQPQVKRETDYYTQHIMSVKSVDDFLKDDRLYSYAMKAWGLEDMSFAKGMMRKVLTDPEFAFGLVDKRYQAFARAFNFNKYGDKTTEQDSATRQTVNKYMQQTVEGQIGGNSPGARLALYFTRTIGEMNKNNTLSEDNWVYQLLGDKALREVVYTALAIPETVGASDIEAQKRLLETRLSRADLAESARLEKFISRFSAMYDMQNRQQVSPALNVLQAVTGRGAGVSDSAMFALQGLRLGA